MNETSIQIQYTDLEKELGYIFKDKSYLELAFRHSSYANEKGLDSNERFEFLGDALLQSFLSQWLYFLYPKYNEGQLSQTRAMLVSQNGLLCVAQKLCLEKYIVYKPTEISLKAPTNRILANTVEALLAAIYLDSQCNHALLQSLIERYFSAVLEKKQAKGAIFDAKTKLQEIFAKQYKQSTLEYRLIEEMGEEHRKQYKIALYVNQEEKAVAIAFSKKQAQQKAALCVLKEYI